MKIHGIARLGGRCLVGGGGFQLGRRHCGGQHCSAALRRDQVWSIAIRVTNGFTSANLALKESLDEQRKKAIPDRGHSRRRDRQGSGAGGLAGTRGGGEKARRCRAFRSFRLRLLGLL